LIDDELLKRRFQNENVTVTYSFNIFLLHYRLFKKHLKHVQKDH